MATKLEIELRALGLKGLSGGSRAGLDLGAMSFYGVLGPSRLGVQWFRVTSFELWGSGSKVLGFVTFLNPKP